jgi:DNA-binding winged helix-turn-helix (wHTH) protein/tetratricopeptide (TPR) repeat protein
LNPLTVCGFIVKYSMVRDRFNLHSTIRFGAFRLVQSPLALYRGGARIDLPSQPLRLLALLVRRSGHIVTHDDIVSELWTGRTVSYSGSLHVAIRQIRLTLGDDASHPEFIETVPREGYRFVATTHISRRWHPVLTGLTTAAAGLIIILALSFASPTTRLESDSENVRLAEYLLAQAEPDGYARSLTYFDAALAETPGSSRALIGAARAALLLQAYDLAGERAQTLLDIDPQHAGALEVRGHVAMMRDRDLIKAFDDISRAIDLNPELAFAHHSMAVLMLLRRQPDLAIRHMAEARRLDPASTLVQADMGWIAYYAGEYDAAARHCETAIALHPDRPVFRYCAIRAAAYRDRPDTALGHITWLMARSNAGDDERQDILSAANPLLAFDQWRLSRYLSPDRTGPVSPVLLATTAASAQSFDVAAAWLAQALEAGDPNVVFAAIDPVFAPMAQNDAIRQIRRQLGAISDQETHITDRSGLSPSPLR